MTPLLFVPIGALIGVFVLTQRSLGLGLVGVLALGYFNGLIRANFLSVYTTFMFDASLLGLYLGFMSGWLREAVASANGLAGRWILLLSLWPAFLTLVPFNDYLVQLVALRATVWFLPVMLVATQLRAPDLVVIARSLAVLNFVALGGALYIHQFGIESLYPQNAVTHIIYMSNDVAGYKYHRIPSFFLSAHAYGGTMLLSLPFLLDRFLGRGAGAFDRGLAAAGVVAAMAGILLCAARQPGMQLLLIALVAWVVSRLHPGVGIGALILIAVTVVVAATDDRLQRITTLEDTEMVSDRVRLSANQSFLELMVEYPAGAGMASSFGTSIPFFLADRAPVAIGLENEYSRILVDQGLVGLGLWVGFLVWLLYRPPPLRMDVPWGFGVVLMYALLLVNWGTAFLGSGTLSSIPASVLLLTQMGILVRVREVTSEARA